MPKSTACIAPNLWNARYPGVC